MPTDIMTIVLQEVLKISPTLISKYPLVQDKLLFLILIPHIILFLFIYAFSHATVTRILGTHGSFSVVLSFVIYIYIIWAGWYGTFLVPIFVSTFQILLVVGILFFVVSLFIHPARAGAVSKLFTEIGKSIGEKTIGKQKALKEVEEKIELVNRKIHETEELVRNTPYNFYLQMRLHELKSEKLELESLKKKIEQGG